MHIFSNAANTLLLTILFIIVPTTLICVIAVLIHKLHRDHSIHKFEVLNDVIKLEEMIDFVHHQLKLYPDMKHVLSLLSLDDFDQLYEYLAEKNIQAYLQSVGKHIRMNLPKGGRMCQTKERETFLFYLPLEDETVVSQILERIHRASSKPGYLDHHIKVIRQSTLVYTCSDTDKNFNLLFNRLESMLYYCKRQGGNTVAKFDNTLDLRSMNTERYKEIKEAIRMKRFDFMFELFYGFIDEKIYGSFARVHYNNDSRKGISIQELILLLENSKDLLWFGKWLIEKSIEHSMNVYNAMHNQLYYTVIPIGLQQLESEGFASYIETLCLKYQLQPNKLIFEVTNPRPTLYKNEFEQNTHLLKKMGCKLLVSMEHEQHVFMQNYDMIKPNMIKFDILHIEHIDKNAWMKDFLQEIDNIVVNVVTKQQLDLLKHNKITYVQGSFYGKKIGSDELLNIISLNRLS